MTKKTIIATIAFISLCFSVKIADVELKVPGRTKSLINDYAGVLTPETKIYLENILQNTRGKYFTGTEIVVTTLKTLNGMSSDSFMQEYAPKWRRPLLLENDNRILIILIIDEKKIRIGVGNHLKSINTPEAIKDIIEVFISSGLQYGDYDKAIKKGVETVVGLVRQGKLYKDSSFRNTRLLFKVVFLVFCVVTALFLARRKRQA